MTNQSKKSKKINKKIVDWSQEEGNAALQKMTEELTESNTYNEKAFKRIQLTDKQKIYEQTIYDNEITFAFGPAGSSKTFTMCYAALKLLYQQRGVVGGYKKIVLCKPIKEAGEELGFLPGDWKDKVSPFMQSYVDNFEQIIGTRKVEEMVKAGEIEIIPLAYMRGRTLRDAIVLLDEAQNALENQLIMFITRKGKNCRMVVAGDIHQYDIRKDTVVYNRFINMLKGVEKIGFVEFLRADIVRDPILQEITDRYEQTFKNNK